MTAGAMANEITVKTLTAFASAAPRDPDPYRDGRIKWTLRFLDVIRLRAPIRR
jgi:hypothetical protein